MILLILPLSLLLILSVLELGRVRDLLSVVVLLSVYSGIVAISFAVLGAVDVAYTEAVVGSSISTILLMLLLTHVDPYHLARGGRAQRTVAALAAAGVGLVLVYGMLALPRFGDPNAPPSTHVSPYYTDNAIRDSNTPNTVTAVLADYRGFDTLIETAVVLTAALACMLVMGAGKGTRRSVVRPFKSVMLSNLLGPLIASLQVFLLYVIMHGHYSPGGAFQGGTLLACSFILPLLANAENAFVVIGPRTAAVMAVLGVVLFAGVGVASMLADRPLLDYGGLPFGPADEPARRAFGTLLIELGVALTVAGSLVSIYYSLERGLASREGGSS